MLLIWHSRSHVSVHGCVLNSFIHQEIFTEAFICTWPCGGPWRWGAKLETYWSVDVWFQLLSTPQCCTSYASNFPLSSVPLHVCPCCPESPSSPLPARSSLLLQVSLLCESPRTAFSRVDHSFLRGSVRCDSLSGFGLPGVACGCAHSVKWPRVLDYFQGAS